MSMLLLSIRDVYKTYTSASKPIHALKGVSLDIYEGEILGLLGVNGAGKTTLSSIIATLIPASAGKILWRDHSIYANVIAYRQRIGLCPQKPDLEPSLTIEEHLIFAGRVYGLDYAAAKVRAYEVLNQLGLTVYAQEKPDVLSGGYKQRVLIARALMHKPDLVILDEPTVGLDPHVRYQLWDLIKGLKQQGVSVILTTHYLDEAEYLADRICVLNKGVVIEYDTTSNLLTRFGETRLEKVFLRLLSESEKES